MGVKPGAGHGACTTLEAKPRSRDDGWTLGLASDGERRHDRPEMAAGDQRADLLDRCLRQCREHGLRLTHSRRAVLLALTTASEPVSTSELAQTPGLKGECDLATIYRTLWALEEIRLVRKVAQAEGEGRYALSLPGTHQDYLVCDECGTMSGVAEAPEVKRLEELIARQTGFRVVDHDLQFHGVCRDCQEKPPPRKR
jgi:Fur family transcriptional regulator, ferric uptake regulator